VADCFGKDIGIVLQLEDSRLALEILSEMERLKIVTLPIHDSFMVTMGHGDTLKTTMGRVYRCRYGIEPNLKTTLPVVAGDPGTP
jgi:hypothetical protein